MRIKPAPISSCFMLAMSLATAAWAGGVPPWQLGMTKTQVSSFSDYGPYKSFSNGDLETYNGLYDGNKENIQFFFNQSGLRRISVYLYEGKSIEEGAEVWKRAYTSLKSHYGEIETPGFADASAGPLDMNLFALSASANTEKKGKSQMAPLKQPDDAFVFSSFMRKDVMGERWYYVTINFDPSR